MVILRFFFFFLCPYRGFMKKNKFPRDTMFGKNGENYPGNYAQKSNYYAKKQIVSGLIHYY